MKTLIRFPTVKIRFLFHPFTSRINLYMYGINIDISKEYSMLKWNTTEIILFMIHELTTESF